MTALGSNWWASPDPKGREGREGSPGDGVEEAYRKIASSVGRGDGGWEDVLSTVGKIREESAPSTATTQQPPPPPHQMTWGEAMGKPPAAPFTTPTKPSAPFEIYKTARGPSAVSPHSPSSSPGEAVSPSRVCREEVGGGAPLVDRTNVMMEQNNNALREAEMKAERLQKQVDELQKMLRSNQQQQQQQQQQQPAYRPPLPPKRVFPVPIAAEEEPTRRRSSSSHQDPYAHRQSGRSERKNSAGTYDSSYEIRMEDLSGPRGQVRRHPPKLRESDKVNFNYGKHLVKTGSIENRYTSRWADSLRVSLEKKKRKKNRTRTPPVPGHNGTQTSNATSAGCRYPSTTSKPSTPHRAPAPTKACNTTVSTKKKKSLTKATLSTTEILYWVLFFLFLLCV